MKRTKLISVSAIVLFVVCAFVFILYFLKERSPTSRIGIDYQDRIEAEYEHIIQQLEEVHTEEDIVNLTNVLIEGYRKLDDFDITFPLQDESDVEQMLKQLEVDQYFIFDSKLLLHKLTLSLVSEAFIIHGNLELFEKVKSFREELKDSGDTFDQAVLLLLMDEWEGITSGVKAQEFREETRDYTFEKTHSRVMEKLSECENLSRSEMINILLLADDFSGKYKKDEEKKEDLVHVLEKIVFETELLNQITDLDVHLFNLLYKLLPLEEYVRFLEHGITKMPPRFRSTYERRLEHKKSIHEIEKEAEKRREDSRQRMVERAKELAGDIGIEGDIDDIWAAVIEGLSYMDTPDFHVNRMISIISSLTFGEEAKPELQEAVKSAIERQLLRYDERDLEPERFLSLYRSRLASQSETIKMAERVIEERAKDGKESPELEE